MAEYEVQSQTVLECYLNGQISEEEYHTYLSMLADDILVESVR